MTEERTGPVDFPARVSRYGRNEPLPERHALRAGPLTAVLESGDLRYIKLGDDLIVLRLYAAVRDRDWNTIEPKYLTYEMQQDDEGFRVRFSAEHQAGDVNFRWDGMIAGAADGVITVTMDGEALNDFLKNRIGWCVLHPMELAGVAASTETPDGQVKGTFPDLIAPHQPFIDMTAISHATPSGGEVTIRFEGDLFEMEDQRNWTDASYKTYSTPLRLPYPAEIKQGDRIWQRVTIQAKGTSAEPDADKGPMRVTVDAAGGRRLPAIGLGLAGHDAPLDERDVALLRAINPAHLHVVLDLTKTNWSDRLALAAAQAGALDAALVVEAVAGADGAGLGELAANLKTIVVPVDSVLVFRDTDVVTNNPVLKAARDAFAAAGLTTRIGGGSRAYFTELNRATLPLDGMDVVSYTLNPQVHAFDNASLTESLAAQAETVRSARAIAGERPLAVGPITLSPRFNPNATSGGAEIAGDHLPPSVDYRQPSLFAAGWLTGSINALGNAGADRLTYFETTGWKGLIERRDHPLRIPGFHSWPGMAFPIYHVLAAVGEFAGGDILPVTISDALRVQALALASGARRRVILANMTDDRDVVALELGGVGQGMMRRLDESTVHLAASDPESFRATGESIAASGSVLTIELPPFGLAVIDAELTSS